MSPTNNQRSETGSSTSASLLNRVRNDDQDAWRRLVRLYGPYVYRWCTRWKLQQTDIDDVFQEVFRAISMGISEFRIDGQGQSFRGWIWTITRNKVADHFRRKARMTDFANTDAYHQIAESAAANHDSPAHDEEIALVHLTLELVRTDFEVHTWLAFWKTAIDCQTASDVAQQLGISIESVYQAKSRVLRRVRRELDGLVE